MEKVKKIKKKSLKSLLFVPFASTAVGFINGLLGAGGGSLVVPLYQSSLQLDAKKAHATAIATMLPQCIISGIIYLLRGSNDFSVMSIVTVGVVIGGIIGSLLLKKINNQILSLFFYFVMVYAGIKFLIR